MVDNGAIGGSQSNPATSGLSTTFSSGGGSSSTTSSPPPSTNTTVIIGVAPQVFRCTGTGLRPNTLHYAYLLTTNVSSDCAPIVTVTSGSTVAAGAPGSGFGQTGNNSTSNTTTTYAYGSPLITDASGKLVFDYAFKPQNSPFQTKYIQQANTTIAIIPVGMQAFKVSSVDGMSWASTFIESKSTS
jgi:hypothetical protein